MIAFVVVLVRLLVPFSILRWPFAGVLLSIAADAFDITALRAFGWGFLNEASYQAVDKVFDMYYLSFAFYVSLKWKDLLAKKISVILFIWRFIGVIAFEITHFRKLLFFAPNIFENFYILAAGIPKIFPKFRLDSRKKLAAILLVAGVPKIVQEYVLHFMEYPLGLRNLWPFIKQTIFK